MTNLKWKQVLRSIKNALDNHQPFSMVRIGDGENIVMAQKSVWSIKTVLRELWAKKANRGKKGVRLPNLKLRNEMVRSIKKANIVGILIPGDKRTVAHPRVKRPLTNKIFRYYKLKPRYTCDAVVNRFLAGRKEFWDVLRGRRVLIITREAERLKKILQKDPYGMDIAGTIIFSDYTQMNRTLTQVEAMKYQFDIALISCGVNSVVLAPAIARLTGKVAIDFGKGHLVVFKKGKRKRKWKRKSRR
ncbi:GT-D fold domain-containing glycosyltransferase [Paenibacillus sp. LHD-38]|uniref:GT-D fold domain-containing glycosyltransferase n=1 Tax=Paenibacillus sp. LHD-38 TaxID=3072143 RepID=UPI0028106ED5|nr:GT-D fold domain-containing glycosyltransferase [Paenibacillus sp. LHD-38]MDQ8735763.1 GT-D fold domain-containing glycosyltransferase [Paenibacillus sp. LHD-38]